MSDNPIRVKAYGKIVTFPAGTTTEAMEQALKEHRSHLDPDDFGGGSYETPQPEALDYAKGFASGANKLVSGAGFLMEAAGAKETGKAVRAFGDRGAKYWNDKMSKGGKLASESQVFVDDDNEDSITGIKLSDDWGKALLMGASQSLPSMFAAAIPGVAVTKGIQALAKLGLAGGAGATIPLLAGTAAPVGVTSNIIARVPSAVGFGAAEGVTAGAMNAADFKTSIEGMTDEELNKSPVYRALKEEHDPTTARSLLAEQAALDLFGKTAVSTGAIGALTGGGALGQAYQKIDTGTKSGILGTMLKGAGSEALQETPQSGGEKFIENLTTQKFLNPDQSTTEGVLAAAASGGAIGAFTGGVVGAGGAINITPDRRSQLLNEKRKVAEMKADAVNNRTMEESAAEIGAAQDIDQALAAATRATTKPVVSANEVLRSEDPTLADIEKLTGLKPTEAIDTAIDEIENPIIDQPQETENVSNQETQQAPTTQASVLGKTSELVLPDGASLPAQWEVIDADNVKASLKEGINQPRDRTRAASDVQIKSIANNPDYRRLSDSPVMDVGSPVISYDGAIVAGNGRFEGVSQAHSQGTGGTYLESLKADLVNKGIDPALVEGMKKPVLVRRITKPFDTRKLALASNSGASLQYSGLELAKIDADRMAGIEEIDIADNGDIPLTVSNIEKIKKSLTSYTPSEMASLVDEAGNLSQDGVKRVRGAILAKAYGNSPALGRLIESTDTDIRNVLGALTRSAGDVAKVREEIKKGVIPKEVDVTENLLQAVEVLSQIRGKGQSLGQYLAQEDIFGEGLDPDSAEVLKFLHDNIRSQKRMAEFVKDVFGQIAQIDQSTEDIFGDNNAPTKKELLNDAKRKSEGRQTIQQGIFDKESGRPDAKVSETETDNAKSSKGQAKPSFSVEGLTDKSPVMNEETFKAKGIAEPYSAYLKAHPNKSEAIKADIKHVENKLVQELQGTGKFDDKTNQAYATPFREFYRVNAERLGIMPSELYERLPLKFKGTRDTGDVLKQEGIDLADTPGIKEFKKGDTTVSYGNEGGVLKIYSMRTPVAKRGKGSARAAMESLIAQADKEGKAIILDSSPLDKRTKDRRLFEFYTSLGFKPTGKKINPVGDPEMRREPSVSSVSKKTSTNNTGEFNPNDPNILKQSTFYSALEKEIGNLKKIANKNGEVSVDQAKAWINSRQKEGKFKQAEVEAVGLMDWLDTLEGKVPVVDVENFVRENGVKVEEVVLEGEGESEIDDDQVYDEAYQNFTENYDGPDSSVYDDAVLEVAEEMRGNYEDERWESIVGLNDAEEVEAWLEEEDVGSIRDLALTLRDRYDVEEILGEDTYNEIRDEAEQDDWENSQDYYMDMARERLGSDVVTGGTEFQDYVLRGGGEGYKELLMTLPNSKAKFNAPHFDRAQDAGAENIFAHTRINEREMDVELTPVQVAEKEAYDAWAAGNNTPEIKQILKEKDEAGRDYRVALEKWKERMVKDTSISDKEYEQAINTLSSNPPEELKPFIARIDEVGAKVKALQEERLAIKPKEPSTSGAKEKVLFVEEIQSDWAQKGRDEGFAKMTERWRVAYKDGSSLGVAYDTKAEAQEALNDSFPGRESEFELRQEEGEIKGIPTAPFVTDTKAWTALVVKRLLRYAAENGFDRIAWTTGVQQAERYRLSKFVESIKATRGEEGKYRIVAINDSGNSVIDDIYEENKLAGTIGKELAEKIIKQPDGEQVYEGLDLDVGGQGMREFYDRIVPSVVNDVAKKLGGGKVETVRMGGKEGLSYDDIQEMLQDFDKYPAGSPERAELRRQQESASDVREDETGKQMSLRITPALKEKVMQGLPLFQRDRAGFNPRTFTISLMDGSDLSSVIHEGGHFYLEALAEMASQPNAPEQIVNDFDTTLQWFGVEKDAWQSMPFEQKRPYHEQWAQSFERYALEGKAPSKEMQSVFDRFQEWMLDVYKSLKEFLKQNPLAGKLNDEVRSVFDRLLATEQDIAKSREAPTKERSLKNGERAKQLERKLREQGYEFTITAKDVRDFAAGDRGKEIEANTAEKIAGIFGRKIVWIDAQGDYDINGVVVPSIKDTIFIDVNTDKAAHAIMGHELSHHLEHDNPDVYDDLLDALSTVIKDHQGYAKKYGIEGVRKDDITKEIVGDIMGDNFTRPEFWNRVAEANPSTFKSIADSIIKWLKNLILKAKSRGLGSDQWVTDSQKAQDILAKAIAKYEGLNDSVAKDGAKFHKVWHGSPHDHSKFDSTKIGTGEGAQAYGYGHYFADRKEVAEFYKENVKDMVRVREINAELSDLSKIMNKYETSYRKYSDPKGYEAAKRYDELMAERDGERTKLGKLYEVELAPEQEDYLLWDKPLSEQSEKVKKALLGIDIPLTDSESFKSQNEVLGPLGMEVFKKGVVNQAKGNDVYVVLSSKIGGARRASEYLHSLGIRGIKYLDGTSRSQGEGAYNYVVFDDKDIEITAKFSKKAAENTLIVQHNLTVKNLLHADRMGGLAAPSIAVADKSHPLTGFGDITLLAEKDLIDPQKGAKIFGSDIYSPRYPELSYDFTGKPIEKLKEMFADGIAKTGDSGFYNDSLQDDPFRELLHNSAAMHQFLTEQGKKPKIVYVKPKPLSDPDLKPFLTFKGDSFDLSKDEKFKAVVKDIFETKKDHKLDDDGVSNMSRVYAEEVMRHRDAKKNTGKVDRQGTNSSLFRQIGDAKLMNKFENYLAEVINRAEPKERIFQGYTYSGTRRYLPHDIDTVIKLLQKNLRGGENFKSGLGSVRAHYSKQFKSIEQIRNSKNSLMSSKDFDAVKEEVNAELDTLSEALNKYGTFSGFNNVENMLSDAAKLGISRALKENGFENVPDRLKIDAQNFLNKLKDMPTEYFEAKLIRRVGLGEFTAAVVPKDTPAQALEILKKNGITDIRKYKPGDNGDRIAQIGKLDRVMFSRRGKGGPFDPNTDIPETLPRKAQRLSQDAFNRFTVIQNWLKEKGVTLSEKADVYQAEERYHSLVANQLEDFREQKRNPLIEKIAKAGFTMADVSDFLEAQHAAEANAAIQKISNNDTDTAYGITDKEAADYLAKADPKLAKLANELRDITEESKQMRLKAGLLSQEEVDAWESTYEHYIPVKGDADAKGGTGKGLKVNFKTKRRLGHGKRDEAVIENIFLDHERAIMQVEKNRVAKHLVMMAAEMQMPEIMTVGQPVKRKTLRNTTAYEVKVSGVTRSVFNNKQAADMFKQLLPDLDKGVSPNDITVEQTKDQRIVAMASPMLAENEINAYIDGHAIRVQINDDLLARAYAKLGVTGFSALVSAGRAFNGYLSKVYTGYNPEFIVTNMIRDFTSGLINLTGEEGLKMAAKASGNYVKSFSSLMRYAVSNGKKSDKWIDMYRANGGNTGAAYLSDLERLGNEVKTEYAAYQGVMANLKSGSFVNASRAAGRKVFNLTLKWIYNLNQAGENAMRLAAFRAMIESGKTPAQAAKAAKNITVNFNRKGELGAEANAAYLFFNASVQGVAALAHAHFKGKNKYQAWGLSSMVGVLGYMSAVALLGGDDDEYDKLNDYTKSRNLLIKAGEGYAQIPIPYGYGFFWNMGRSIAEAQHKGELGNLPWHIAASAIEELTPFSDTVVGTQDGFHFDQVLLGLLPTVIKIPAQPAFNKQLFSGSELMPDSAFQQFQPDREKLWRATQGTMYDRMSGWLDEAIGADVSPETLKHYTRTFTGGAGAMVDATVSAAMLKKEGAELEPSEIPFVRKAYSKLTIREHRAAYYKAREEAKKTAEEFTRAKARNDVTTINKLVRDEAEMIGLDAYANKLSKAISAMRDMQDAIRLNDGLNAAEKRVKIKELEITEQKFYDRYLDVFKIEKAKMKARGD